MDNTDCLDSNGDVYPDGAEICNGIDDNCDGVNDEGVELTTYYLDNDGDGFGGASGSIQSCEIPSGYIQIGGDCNDNNVNVRPTAQELCSTNFDDDCDGLINEICFPGNDNPGFASNNPLSISTTGCNTLTGTLLAATPTPSFGSSSLSNNSDVWYYFTAIGPGVTLRCTPTTNDIGLELRSSSGELLKIANVVSGIGEEIMNYAGLTLGNQYYLRVMNMTNQPGGSFSLCSRRFLYASSAFNLTNQLQYNSGCVNVHITNVSSTVSSIFILTPVGGGTDYIAYGPAGVPLGSFLSSTGSTVNYNTVYTGRVIKSVLMLVGGGGTEVITYEVPCANTLNVLPLLDLDLLSSFACPTSLLIGSEVRTDRWLCGAEKYQWRFERYVNGVQYTVNGSPVVIEQYGPLGSRKFNLLANYGFQPGTEWRVKIRPVFPNGVHGDYGPDEQCITIRPAVANAPLIEEESDEMVEVESKYTVYPNPSLDGQLRISGMTDESVLERIIIRDASGRVVEQWETSGEEQTMVSMNLSELKAGLYWISITGSGSEYHQRWIKQ
jgi:hypothetical protein